MTPTQYHYARTRLGRSHDDMGFIGVSRRSSFRYEKGHADIPQEIGMLLELLTAPSGDLASLRRRLCQRA